ncbi:hypothetical protein SAMN05216464_1114 [Mucilaginibacter pineti]|uniref:Uncharacterized protein n=1 Tax=Mucilaginibacter pineti TaxID=1391627 RepID=A0A1G7H1I4_9SPHI|nr:hypothetical protein [Mucilaginibacter pineti]SDE94009.1 hypothetical protein SAMN05216464_1114 [Mucilaginibacter pineti]
MKIENPVALRFLLQDELYLLNTDKLLYTEDAIAPHIAEQPAASIIQVAPTVKEPEPVSIVPAPEVKTPPLTFNYLGKNLKNFVVLVNYPALEFIDDAHLTALTNIIKRKELAIDDLAIVNLAHHSTAKYDELLTFFKPTKLLILGKAALPQDIAPLVLNVPKPLGALTALQSFSFGEMMDSVDNKKAFWEQVKGF